METIGTAASTAPLKRALNLNTGKSANAAYRLLPRQCAAQYF